MLIHMRENVLQMDLCSYVSELCLLVMCYERSRQWHCPLLRGKAQTFGCLSLLSGPTSTCER